MPLSFTSKVAGVTFENRQVLVSKVQQGEFIGLLREPDNKYDKNAIKVMNQHGMQLGYIPKDLARDLAKYMDLGISFNAVCKYPTGGSDGLSYGLVIEIMEVV